MDDCLFCKIVAGDVSSAKIYEDEIVYAFLDISPINKGHALVIPKEHATNIFDTPDETLKHMAAVIKKLSIAIRESQGAEGMNVYMNNEKVAGQVVFHTHTHIIPRYKNDGRDLWHGDAELGTDREEVAERIRQKLK